jgi:hypothetical protein
MVLAGMGQCGIIVRARLQVIDSPPRVFTREYKYPGAAPEVWLADMSMLARQEQMGAIGGALNRQPDGTYVFSLKITYWSSESPAWLSELHGTTDGTVKTWSFYDYAKRGVPPPTAFKPHPYVSGFVPRERADAVISTILATPSSTNGAAIIAIFPALNANYKQTLQSMPDGEESVHIRLYRTVTDGEGSANHLAILKSNTEDLIPLLLDNRATFYLPHTPLLKTAQLVAHFGGEVHGQFTRAKRRFDHNSILGMSAGLFPWAGPGPACTDT